MPTPVIIVGAGPVGLTAALALSAANIELRVVDAASGLDRRMRASTFHPPTLDMLADLGIADELLTAGLKVPCWQMRQHESGEFVEFDLGVIDDVTRHPFRLQLEQHRYCEIALAKLKERGVEIEFDSPVVGLQQSADVVAVELGDGQTLDCQWLIGADGASSAVRKACSLEYGGKTYTHSSVLVSTEFPFHDHLEQLANVSYCWSARGPFTLLRLPQLWRASLYPGVEDLDDAATESRVREWLAFIHPEAADAELFDLHPYRVHERCVDAFRVGRVLLAGDAAHLNPPSGGMGMNGGIHDAVNLCGKLKEVFAGADDALLDRYDRQRRQVAAGKIIPQAAANRARMHTNDLAEQTERLAKHRDIVADENEYRDFLLKSSMITALQEAESIA